MWMLSLFLVLHTLLSPEPVISPASIPDTFDAGVAAYAGAQDEADYRKAARHFQSLIDRGIVHEDVYYNLGNCHFQLGELGPAVYFFEKAIALHPGHVNARYNLDLTRQVLARKFKDEVIQMGRDSTWVRLVHAFEESTLTAAFLFFWFLFFSALMALWFIHRQLVRITLITAAVLLGLVSFSFGTLLLGREIHERTVRHAIVLPDQIQVREAPQEVANPAFLLHAGHRVRLGIQDRAWVKIQLPNGMEGWVERRNLGFL